MIRKSTLFLIGILIAVAILTAGCFPGRSSSVPRAEAVSRSRPLTPPGASSGRGLYLVPLGKTPPFVVQKLAAYYTQSLGIRAQALAPIRVPASVLDSGRNQLVAEDLIALIRSRHPDKAADTLIGIVDGDIYSRESGFRFTFSNRDFGTPGGAAVVSYARMDPNFFGESRDPELLNSRLRKMVSKNVGILYYRLPESRDPRSVLFSPVMALDDLDRMGQGF